MVGRTASFVSEIRRLQVCFWVLTEKVWISGNRRAKICIRAFLPFIFQVGAIDTLQSHIRHTTSHNVKTSGKRNDIVLALFPVGSDDAFLGELLDWVSIFGFGVDVDDIDVVTIEDLVVVLFEARALDTEWVRRLFWEEDFVLSGVFDTRGLLASPEVLDRGQRAMLCGCGNRLAYICFTVCFGVEKIIFVSSKP